MSKKKRISRILAIFLAASMVLSYNSGFYLSVWAAGEDTPAAEEEMMADPATGEEGDVSEETGETAQQADQDESLQQKEVGASEESEVIPEAETEAEEEASAEMPKKDKYTYEDSRIRVTAVLDDASAIPDDAELVVTPVTKDSDGYNYDAYMEALNKEGGSEAEGKGIVSKLFGGDKEETSDVYTEDNTLLYDIAFIIDKNGKKVEVQPEEGKVSIKAEFLKDQLTETLGAEKADDVTLVHLPLSDEAAGNADTTAAATDIKASDITVEKVDADVTVGKNQEAAFETGRLSVWAFSSDSNGIVIPEPDADTFANDKGRNLIDGPFGDLANFGLVGFTSITQNQHVHSNFATKDYIIEGNGEFGRRQTNKLPEVFYIENSISGINGIIDAFAPGSRVVLGYELGKEGTIKATPDQITYSASFGGKDFAVNVSEPAAKKNAEGKYESTLFRQEKEGSHYVDLVAMKAKAAELSSKFSDRTSSEVTITEGYEGNHENFLIVETGGQDLSCLNLKADEATGKVFKIDESAFNNKLDQNGEIIPHILIVNIDAAGKSTVTLPKVDILNGSGYTGEVQTWTKGNVVLNVYDSTKQDKLYRGTIKNVSGQISGSILAPEATMDIVKGGSINGQVFADKIIINEEFHRDSITFTNKIPSVGGLRVAKTLNGAKPGSDTFQFKLEGLDGAPMPNGAEGNVLIKENGIDGIVQFGFLNFDEAAFDAGKTDYRYRVSEVIPADATPDGEGYKRSGDIRYDTSQYIIEVHAHKSGGIGIKGYTVYEADGTTKIADLSYEEGKKGAVTFNNVKAESGNAKAILQVKKEFDGEEWPEDGFSFDLTKVGVDTGNGNGIDSSQLDNMPPEKHKIEATYEPQKFYTHITATKDEPIAVFREIEYGQVGTYYYTLKESIPEGATESSDGKTAEKDGIIYDNVTHNIVVSVEDAGSGKKFVSVKYDGQDSLTINNKVKRITGSLELTKTIKGDITEEEFNGALKFEVTTGEGENQKWLKTDGTLSDTQVELTLKDFTHEKGTDNYTLKIDNVLIGDYSVKETTKDFSGKDVTVSYTVDGGDKQKGKTAGVTVAKDKETAVAFEDDYKNQTGSLELKKTIKGDITEDEANGALKFEVKSGEKWLNKDGSLSNQKVILTLGDFTKVTTADGAVASYKLTINDVEIGNYTVTETTKDVTGKDVTVTYKVGNGEATKGDAATAAVAKDATTTVAFEDDYKNQTGNLELTKTIKGDITEDEANGALKFEVKSGEKWLNKDGSLSNQKVELTLGDFTKVTTADGAVASYKLTINDVEIGNYTVTETTKDVTGKDVTVTYKVGNGEAAKGDAATAAVTKDATTTVAFENDYKEEAPAETGKLVIKKSVGGDVTKEEFEEGAISFVVSTKVTEDGKEVTKYLKSDGTLSNKEADGTYVIGKAGDGFETTDGGKTYTKTFDKAPAGSYTVNEKNSKVDGYDLVTEQSDVKEKTATVAKDGTATAEFKDVYEKTEAPAETGKLVIKKSVGGDVTKEEFEEGAISFVVSTTVTEDGKKVTKYLKSDGTLSDKEADGTYVIGKAGDGFETTDGGKTYTKTFDKVPAGSYTVNEKNSKVDGYDLVTEQSDVEEKTATVAKDGTATAAFKDFYEKPVAKKTGDLIITKTIEGKVTREEIEKAGIRFEIRTSDGKWLDKDGNVSEEKVELTLDEEDGFTPTADGKTWTKVLRNVPVGTYTVTETYSIIDGYEVTVVKKSSTAEVKEGEEAKAELAGVYEKDKGNAGDSKDKKDDKKPSKGVNTGDDAPFAAWLTLMLTALAGFVASVFKRRSDRK